MQTLIITLLILSFLSFILQLSLLKKQFSIFIICGLIAATLYFMYPFAIEQSYANFHKITQNQQTISNIIVLQIIECLLGILFSIFLIRIFYNEKVHRFFYYFRFFPGIVIFPALFYIESAVFLNISGVNFKALAIAISISIPLIIITIRFLLQHFVPEYDLRLELKFILHILQLITSIAISINIFRLPTANVILDFNIWQLLVFFGLVLFFGIMGLLHYRRYINKVTSKNIYKT